MTGVYHYLWLFLIFSVLGWFAETCLVSFQQKRPINRGFLTGPMCPIYGFGICLVVLFLSPLPSSWWVLLVGGGLIATALEYVVGWLLEKMFCQRWWDYSDHRYHLNGRIALPETLVWGPLAVVAMLYIVPWLDGLINRIPRDVGWWLLGGVTLLTAIDIFIILKRMRSFEQLATRLLTRSSELRDRLDMNADALRVAVRESVAFVVEEHRTRWTRIAEGFDKMLKKRLTGAYPDLVRRWMFDVYDKEDDRTGDDDED